MPNAIRVYESIADGKIPDTKNNPIKNMNTEVT